MAENYGERRVPNCGKILPLRCQFLDEGSHVKVARLFSVCSIKTGGSLMASYPFLLFILFFLCMFFGADFYL